MPRYFMHLRNPSDEILDPDGVTVPPEAVVGMALFAARDCMAHDLRSGRLDLDYWIDVENELGEIVHTLRFADAVKIAPARPASQL
jgi:hypothetical protein